MRAPRAHRRTAFGGPGARDAFELVTRAVTGGRYAVDPALARPERGRARERFVFRLGHRDRVRGARPARGLRHGRVHRPRPHRGARRAQERRLDALKLEMAERVMARPAEEVYDAEVVPSGEERAGLPGSLRWTCAWSRGARTTCRCCSGSSGTRR